MDKPSLRDPKFTVAVGPPDHEEDPDRIGLSVPFYKGLWKFGYRIYVSYKNFPDALGLVEVTDPREGSGVISHGPFPRNVPIQGMVLDYMKEILSESRYVELLVALVDFKMKGGGQDVKED